MIVKLSKQIPYLDKLSNEQKITERQYDLPYNWCIKPHSRHYRQKMGLWNLAYELAGNVKNKKVLDAGCGDGWYSACIVEKGGDVTGVDYSEKAIAFAKCIVSDAVFHHASIAELPFKDKTFDIIFSFQVLEHIPLTELPKAIEELARVLKDEGIYIVSVPSKKRPQSKAHFQHFTLASLKQQLRPSFVVTEVVGQEHHSLVLHMLERVVENRFWLIPGLASYFNRYTFQRLWNKTTSEQGQNIVAQCKKNK